SRISADVHYTPSTVYGVEIQAQQNFLNILETYTANGNLVVRFKNDVRVRSHDRITVNVSAPSLNNLRLSGSGNLTAAAPITSSDMDIDVSGSGSMTLQKLTTAGAIHATLSGSGNITVSEGSATEVRSKISGSGNIDLRNVPAKKATTTTSGSGDTWVNVSESLDVTISGSGSVYYKGSPIINTRISGSGKVLHQ
ncbi:MAG: DUF2807 domain-containing protein, partial [Bacteroidota bacterium]|nr:DUF2807 domain-containing protein [Bacteroidota bacterium]